MSSIKDKVKCLMYDFVKVCPPARKLIRNALFGYRKMHYNSNTKGISVNPRQFVFCTFSGRGYSDSPRAIYEYMVKQPEYADCTFYWAFMKPEQFSTLEQNPNTKLVKYGTKPYEQAMAGAKYWIFNYRVSDHIWPKAEQVYVECWHGTPLKRLGYDLTNSENVMNSTDEIRQKYDLDTAKFKYILSPSPFASEKFTSAWNLKGWHKEDAVLELGYPRNDFLLSHTDEDVQTIKQRLHITPAEIGGKKVILYAPTWRDNQHDDANGYSYKLGVDFDRLRRELGEAYIILFRAHYLVASTFDFVAYEGFVYNVSDYPDINDLYIAADLLITDYSSVFFDYANLKKPMVFYMYDLAAYRDDIRGFYLSLDELPGPIVETEDDLISAIRSEVSGFVYDERYQRFHEKFNPLDDGFAAKRVIEQVIKENS